MWGGAVIFWFIYLNPSLLTLAPSCTWQFGARFYGYIPLPRYQANIGTTQPGLVKYHLSDRQEMKKQTQAIKICNIAILGKNFQRVFFFLNGPGSQKYYDVLNVKAMKQCQL